MNLSAILKELRISVGLTQKELATKLGIGQSTIVGYEKGIREPTVSNLALYAKYFNISIDYITGLEDDFGVWVDDKEKKPDTLSAEERRLLEGYREINAAGKKLVMQTVETLRGTSVGSGSWAESSKIG